MSMRGAAIAMIVWGLAGSAAAQDCAGPQASLLRHAVIVCDHGTTIFPGRELPATCGVAQTLPACPAGFANPIASDVAGVWHDAEGLTFVLKVDDAGQFTGTIASPRPGLSHIQSGGFDAATRTLSFSYVTVGGYAANAVLRLSDDNSALTGRWAWGVGTLHGVWRLSRTR